MHHGTRGDGESFVNSIPNFTFRPDMLTASAGPHLIPGSGKRTPGAHPLALYRHMRALKPPPHPPPRMDFTPYRIAINQLTQALL